MASFDHPIIYGTFCASVFSMVWLVLPEKGRWRRVAAILGSVFLSASSACYLAAAFQIGLISWQRLARGIQHRWTLLIGAIAFFLFIVDIASNRSLPAIVISSLTLSPQTGWVRLVQWDNGWSNVADNPIYGLGYRDWSRPGWLSASVDDFWLLVAMKFGVPGLVAAVGSVFAAIYASTRNIQFLPTPRHQAAVRAWVFTMITISIIGITVDYWKGAHAFFFFLLGQGIFLGDLGTERAKLVRGRQITNVRQPSTAPISAPAARSANS